MRTFVALAAVLALVPSGCGRSLACGDVGGIDGVTVEIPSALSVARGLLTVEVCDDSGCASATDPVRRYGSAPESATFSFAQLGRAFDDGSVDVEVRLTDGRGVVVAHRQDSLSLSRSYPNGRECDGDGFVHGTLRLSPSDTTMRLQ